MLGYGKLTSFHCERRVWLELFFVGIEVVRTEVL